MPYYGIDNELRLSGFHETSHISKFTSGIGNRGVSVRIPLLVHLNKKGYLEDRRPASNVDPYVGNALLFDTLVLGGGQAEDLTKHYDAWKQEREGL